VPGLLGARFHNSRRRKPFPALSRDVQNKPGGIISPWPSALAPADKETGNDDHDHDQPESCDDPRHIFALALVHFAFAFSALRAIEIFRTRARFLTADTDRCNFVATRFNEMLVSIRDLSCLSSSGVHNLLAVLLFIATISPSPSAPALQAGGSLRSGRAVHPALRPSDRPL
jgi:hypothetical protein